MERLILNHFVIAVLAVSVAFTSCGNSNETKLREFTVTFESNGSSFVESKTVKEGEKVLKPSPDPTKNGYTFAEWFKEETLITEWQFETDVVTSNMKLYAKWIENSNEGGVYTGKIISKGNPCPPSNFPCVPAVVLWLETTSCDYVLSIDSHWILDDKIVIDGVEYLIDDEVEITGTRTVWQDIHSKEYFNLEIENIKTLPISFEAF